MYLDKNGLNVIIKVSRNAKGIEGTSNLMKADTEQPDTATEPDETDEAEDEDEQEGGE